jgi:anti-sigma factor RsiW
MTAEFELVPDVLSAYLDGELDAPERAAVEDRLAASPEWRDELAEVRAARDALRALPERQAPPGFWAAVEARVGADEPEDDAAAVEPVPIATAGRRRRWPWFAAAAAAVAAVVAVIVVPHRTEVRPNVTAVVAQHGAQGSDTGEPVSMLAPVGPMAGFRR